MAFTLSVYMYKSQVHLHSTHTHIHTQKTRNRIWTHLPFSLQDCSIVARPPLCQVRCGKDGRFTNTKTGLCQETFPPYRTFNVLQFIDTLHELAPSFVVATSQVRMYDQEIQANRLTRLLVFFGVIRCNVKSLAVQCVGLLNSLSSSWHLVRGQRRRCFSLAIIQKCSDFICRVPAIGGLYALVDVLVHLNGLPELDRATARNGGVW